MQVSSEARRASARKRQVGFPVIYKGKELNKRLVLDFLVGNELIVEIKAVEKCHAILLRNC